MIGFIIGLATGLGLGWALYRRRLLTQVRKFQERWRARLVDKDDEISYLRGEISSRERAMAASERRVRFLESALTSSMQHRSDIGIATAESQSAR